MVPSSFFGIIRGRSPNSAEFSDRPPKSDLYVARPVSRDFGCSSGSLFPLGWMQRPHYICRQNHLAPTAGQRPGFRLPQPILSTLVLDVVDYELKRLQMLALHVFFPLPKREDAICEEPCV